MLKQLPSSKLLAYLALAFVLVALAWGVAGRLIYIERETVAQRGVDKADRLADFFEQQSRHIFDYSNSYLQFLRREYILGGIASVRKSMADIPLDMSIVSHITIMDKEGVPRFISGRDVTPKIVSSDRPYFVFQQNARQDEPFISLPLRGRSTGKVTVRLVRRIMDSNGAFDGVIFAAIDVNSFVDLFSALDLGEKSVALLIGEDHQIRIISANGTMEPGQKLDNRNLWGSLEKSPTGRFTETSSDDGMVRYYSYRKISNMPLVILTCIEASDVSKSTKELENAALAIAMLTSLIILAVTLLIIRDTQAATRLSEREARHIALINSVSESTITIDARGIVEWVNDVTEQTFGYSREELVGNNISMLADKKERLKYFDYLENYFKTGVNNPVEGRYHEIKGRRKDGTLFAAELSINEFQIGAQLLFVQTIRDITGRKQAEDSLKRSETRLIDAIESFSDGFIYFDNNENFVMCNSKYRELYAGLNDILVPGLTLVEFIRISIERGTVVDDRDNSAKNPMQTKLGHFREETSNREVQLRTGQWILYNNFVTSDGGLVGIRTNITERKSAADALARSHYKLQEQVNQQTQHLQDINERLSDELERRAEIEVALRSSEWRMKNAQRIAKIGNWYRDLKTNEITWSDEQYRIFGLDPEKDRITYDKLRKMVHPDDRAKFESIASRTVEQGQIHQLEYRIIRADGEERILRNENEIIRSESGENIALHGIIHDVTEQYEIERLKSEFVSTVSHELRTPLTSIRGSLGLVASGAVGEISEPAQELVELASNNTERLIKLVNDLLDLEKSQAGKLEYAFDQVNIGQLVADAVRANQGYAEEFSVSFVMMGNLSDVYVYADASRLTQVMANLLSNAAKFSPPGGQVEVSVEQRGNQVCVGVRDYGDGIPKEYYEMVFVRFIQVDSSDTRNVSGTGLGLSIAKSIIERHSGRIYFESEMGVGSTFYFEIPVSSH